MAPSPITRHPAQSNDAAFAKLTHHAAYHDVVVAQFGDWNPALQDEFFARDWGTGTGFDILMTGDVACGYCRIIDGAQRIDIIELVIAPAFQNRGFGGQLLRDIIERARQRGVPLTLGTLHRNRARALYERLGFIVQGSTATHIQMILNPPGQMS